MAAITINGLKANVPDDATILQAAKSIGIHIPTLCNFEGVQALGSCRICVVEVEGARTLQVSCMTKVRDGMVIRTNSGKVRRAPQGTLRAAALRPRSGMPHLLTLRPLRAAITGASAGLGGNPL